MICKSRLLVVGAASLLALNACKFTDQSTGAGTSNSAVAATVNGKAISEQSVGLLVQQRTAQGQSNNAESRKEIIDHLAMQLLISQEAVKKGLDKTPEVQDQTELATQSILANSFIQDYLKNNPVNDEVLKAEYEKVKGQISGTEYKASHILVDKEADAKAIIAKLKSNPKAFGSLAKAQSKDPGSKDKGGDLGWFDPRGMVPEFGAAVAKLSKGKFSEEPVKSQFGYHVILLEDSRSKQAPALDQIKPMLQQHVQQQNLKKLFDDLKAKAKIDIVATAAPAPASAPAPAKDSKPADSAKKP